MANNFETFDESNGDSIYKCATALDACLTTVESCCSTSSALRNPAGFLVNETAVASAKDSRLLEIAAFNNIAAIGAKIKIRNEITKAKGF